ncbi:DUF3888 domain-containing protein [Clostridium intestinale]|uniref:DUF3888 domain-containing protein n=1 Tax=Clostridium intestinale TaxID=36845 RepID=UPI002DD65C74|nr:DUF3888 domain-containing protein [Clostridium intestinale]WRY51872.1 DUF3888 domain-containing protein [Clostridium intestinale]
MKRRLAVISLIISISILLFQNKAWGVEKTPYTKLGLPYKYTPEEGSIEELYKDIIATLIEPYITKEIEKYYGKAYMYDLFDMEFLKIERPNGYRSFSFIVTVEVRPFIGAHNTLGVDDIIMKIEAGEVKVEKFKHIKSFPIPDYLKQEVS